MPTTAPAPARLVAAACVLGAAGLLGAAVLGSAVGEDTASRDTRVVLASEGAVIVAEDGITRRPAAGLVRPGETVRAAFEGVVLKTGEREVRLGDGTAVVVEDGARQRLEEGEVLVQADEDALAVITHLATVEVQTGGVVRVSHDDGGLLAAALQDDPGAEAAVVRGARRSAGTSLPGLRQLRVRPGVPPGTPRPLQLDAQGDPWEARVLPDVVRADQVLRELELRFEEEAELLVRAAVATAGSPGQRAERAVRRALAHQDGVYDPEVEQRVGRYRDQDGSWGVAAALTEAEAEDARAWSDGLVPDAPVLALPLPGAPDGADVPPLLPAVPVGPAPQGDAAPAAEDDAPQGADRPEGQRPSPRPTPSPSPSPVGVVEAVVDAVLDLVPVDPPAPVQGPAPAPAPAPAAPVLAPAPAVTVPPVQPLLTGGLQGPPGQVRKELAELGVDVKVKDLTP